MNALHYHASAPFLRVTQRLAEVYQDSGPCREVMIKSVNGAGVEVVRRPLALHLSPTARRAYLQRAVRVDLGAVLQEAPLPNTRVPFRGRELVFDVDQCKNRECDCEDKVCDECWRMLFSRQARYLVELLKKQLGAQWVTAFFSGRKGFHVLVCDHDAFTLDRDGRRGVLKWLQRSCNIIFDEQVTIDPRHMSRCPLSLHQDTHNLMVPLDLRDPKPSCPVLRPGMDEFLPQLEHHITHTLQTVYPP